MGSSNGEEAEAIANEKEVDIIVSDVMMPGIGGIELTKRIKSVKETAHIPIIMVSGRHEMEQQMAALSAGQRCISPNRLMRNISVSLFVRCWNVRKY